MVREKAREYYGRGGGVAEKGQEECQNRKNSMAENSEGSEIVRGMARAGNCIDKEKKPYRNTDGKGNSKVVRRNRSGEWIGE